MKTPYYKIKLFIYTAVLFLPIFFTKTQYTVDKFGNTDLIYAVRQNNIEAVKTLLHYYSSLDSENYNNLFYKFIDHTNNCGHTALTYAVIYKNTGIVETLLNYGAAINIRDTAGKSALDYVPDFDFVATPEIEKILFEIMTGQSDSDDSADDSAFDLAGQISFTENTCEPHSEPVLFEEFLYN